jgi:hypothetical protein
MLQVTYCPKEKEKAHFKNHPLPVPLLTLKMSNTQQNHPSWEQMLKSYTIKGKSMTIGEVLKPV